MAEWKQGGRGRPPKKQAPPAPPPRVPGSPRNYPDVDPEETVDEAEAYDPGDQAHDGTDPAELPGNGDGDDGDGAGGTGGPPSTGGTPGQPTTAPPGVPELKSRPYVKDPRDKPATYPRHSNGLPIPPYRIIKQQDDFIRYVAALSVHNWNHTEMYVYQRFPKHRLIEGRPGYLTKYGESPVDLDRILTQYGSGRYHFMLNDSNIQGNRRTVMQALFNLESDDHPEKYDLERLDMVAPINAPLVDRLIREGKINKTGEIMSQDIGGVNAAATGKIVDAFLKMSEQQGRQQSQPAAANVDTQAHAKMMDSIITTMGQANKATLDAAMSQLKQNDPAAMITMLTALREFVQPPAQAGGGANDLMMKMLMEESREARKEAAEARREASAERQRQHEVQMKSMEQKATATDPLGQLTQMLKIKELLGGGGTGEPRNWKEQAVGYLGDNLPQILEVGSMLVAGLGRGNVVGEPAPVHAQVQARPQAQVQSQAQAHANAQTIPAGQQTIDTSAARPAQAQAEGADGGTGAGAGAGSANAQVDADLTADPNLTPAQRIHITRIRQLQGQIGEHGKFLVNALAAGNDGYQFAQFMVTATGDQLVYDRAAAFTADEWMTAIFSFPQLQQRFTGVEARVQRFIEEFLDWGTVEDAESEPHPDDEIADGPINPLMPVPLEAVSVTPIHTPTPKPKLVVAGKGKGAK